MAEPVTIQIKLKRRSFLGSVLYLPKTIKGHYRLFRKHLGRFESLKAACLLASHILYINGKETDW